LIDWDEVRKLDSLRRSGHPSEALAELQRLRITCADNEARASILLNESICYCDLGQYPEAVEAAQIALRLLPAESPSRPFAEFSLACAHQLNGELELAAEELRAFLQQHRVLLEAGDNVSLRRDAQHRLAATLISLGHGREPMFLLEILKAEATHPAEVAELNYREAQANVFLGRHAVALDLFEQALAGALDFQFVARAHFHLGEILFGFHEFQRAHREFEIATKLAGKDSPDHDAFANWLRAAADELRKSSHEALT
jgi:tetratricopeptide (TPR) repeat protein